MIDSLHHNYVDTCPLSDISYIYDASVVDFTLVIRSLATHHAF